MNKSALMFTIITLITIIAWVFFSVWRVLNTRQLSDDIVQNAVEIRPLSDGSYAADFDAKYLQEIYQRNK